MSSIFTEMLEGRAPARFVWQDARSAAIVSNTPIRPGHCIVFPREEANNWLDLSPELASHLMATCQQVGRAIAKACRPVRVSFTIISIAVPHVHVHLVPLNAVAELDFAKQDQNARPDELDASAETIRLALREPGYRT